MMAVSWGGVREGSRVGAMGFGLESRVGFGLRLEMRFGSELGFGLGLRVGSGLELRVGFRLGFGLDFRGRRVFSTPLGRRSWATKGRGVR